MFRIHDGGCYSVLHAGVLRGLGRQRISVLRIILGFWILAIPIGSILAFFAGVDVFGLW
jgi:MATE family multidrug resistance protein